MRGINGLAGICASVVVTLALGLAVAPCAFAGATSLTLRTAKGPLANGAPLAATSSNAVLATNVGRVECEESAYIGSLQNNAGTTDRAQVTSAFFSGDYENMLGACKSTSAGPVVSEAARLPWMLEFSVKQSALLSGSVQLRVSFPDTMPEVSCLYEGRKQIASFRTGTQMALEFKDAAAILREGPPENCPADAALTATFAVSSEGEPVEAVLGHGGEPEEEETGSLSGMVTNAAAEGVEGVTVEACEEEEEAHACLSAQSGAGGHYSIANVPPGFYVLVASPPAHSGYATTQSEEFDVLAGAATTENLQLTGAGSVSGEISSESGAPLSGVQVSLCEQESGKCHPATTESVGGYSFAEVAAGPYRITATPPVNSGYARLSSGTFAVAEGQNATKNLKLPEAGSVTGVVTEQHSNPVPSEIVVVCAEEECFQSETNAFGEYTIEGVGDGEYVANVAPSYSYDSATSPKFTVSGRAASTVNLTVVAPVGPPAGTEMPGTETVFLANSVAVPLFFWQNEAPLKTNACVGGNVTATVTGTNTQTQEVQTTSPVTLHEGPASSGKFAGLLPRLYPVHGPLTIAIKIEGCPQPSEEETKEFNAYVDPSGVVVDGNHADATVSGATVTLLAGPQSFGPFTAVPNGSTVMSPANRKNSDTTGSLGEFGWDTLPGYYQVEAHKAGCGSTTTPAFQVPPPVTNLQLVLHCSPVLIETAGLPTAKREVHYETQLVAGGEDPPFKWKKKAALPKGLKLNGKTGVLSGTMKRKKVKLGIYAIEVEVKDAARHITTMTLPLKVR